MADLSTLSFREHVRLRPGMYIGNMAWYGFSNMIRGILNFSHYIIEIDQFEFEINESNHIILKLHHSKKQVLPEWLNKPNESEGNEYYKYWKYSNFDMLVLNYLSSNLESTIYTKNKEILHNNIYNKGILQKSIRNKIQEESKLWKIDFQLDKELWQETFSINPKKLIKILKRFTHLTRTSFKFSYLDSSKKIVYNYHPKDGLVNYFNDLIPIQNGFTEEIITINKKIDDFNFEIALSFFNSYKGKSIYFCNQIKLMGGDLEKGIISGIRKGIRLYLKKHPVLFKVSISKKIIDQSFISFSQIEIKNPNFIRATRRFLDAPFITQAISEIVKEKLYHKMINNPKRSSQIINYFKV